MRRILVSFFVFLGATLFTFFGYQLWQTQANHEFSDVIQLHESSTIQIVSASKGERLVPEGVVLAEGDVTELYYTYLVHNESEDHLDIYVADAMFTKNNIDYFDEDNLLDFAISVNPLDDTHTTVTVIVRLNMPKTQQQYQLIQGSEASFQLYVERS